MGRSHSDGIINQICRVMIKRSGYISIAFVMLLALCMQLPVSAKVPAKEAKIKVVWDAPEKVVARGGYGRVHRLNDGRLMLAYSAAANNYAIFSDDNGLTWSDQPHRIMANFVVENAAGKAKVHAANPEFAQLSEENPYHPGRIIFACNYRPMNADPKASGDDRYCSTVFPYTIAIKTSDDNGKTWSKMKHVYKSEVWQKNALRGCWEPFVLELPDGTVQIYFADETPYWRKGSKWQNISVIESKDGGDSWSAPRIVSQNGSGRDGMPVVLLFDDMLYMAIETSEPGTRLHPVVISNPLTQNWKTTVAKDSDWRFHPFKRSLKSDVVYSGAPYIIATENYIVYSYQISDISDDKKENDTHHCAMEVQVCPKSEIKDGHFYGMRAATRPIEVDQWNETAVWNSLCDLGGDEILAVSQYGNAIWLVRGRIMTK